jgi:hypothetical protein
MKQNIQGGFRWIGIWPFMENKTQPINIYTIGNSNGDQGGEDHYSSDYQVSHSHIEESIAT